MSPRTTPGQGELDLTASAPVDPAAVASVKDVERVVALLQEHAMLTAAEICEKFGWQATENRKRKVRSIARAAFPGILSFSMAKDDGSRFDGYKLLSRCTLAEAWAVIHALESLERDLVARKKLLLDQIHTGKVGGL